MAVNRPFLSIALLFLISGSRTDDNICVKPCTCLGHFMDCSNVTSSFVWKDLPSWVKNLDLSSNGLNGKSMGDFGHLVDLVVLKLNRNSFSDVPLLPDTLDSLSELILSYNEISLTNSSSTAIHRFPWLHTLDLSNNHIRELPAALFPNNSLLQVLNLNNNWLRKVESGRLENLTQLQDLRISRNKLRNVSKDAFRHLRHLHTLDLNRNQLTMLESLMFQDLAQLSTLRLRRNNITLLEDGVFWGLKNITILQLDHNNVHNISKAWLYGLDSLLHLNLSHNRIRHIMDPDCWSFNPSLQELDLSHNLLETVGRTTLNHLSNLQKLRLNFNRIAFIEEGAFNCTPNLQELDLSGNNLSWASEEMNGIFNGLGNLLQLSLSANRISSINQHAFDGMDSVEILNLGNNSLQSLQENPWAKMAHLRQLTLNATALMCDCSLAWLPLWLNQQSFASDVHAVCAYPLSLQGMSIMDVPAQNFSCDGIPNPHIVEDPKTQMVLKGTNITLHCRANSSSDETMIFRWKRDNVELSEVDGVSVNHFWTNMERREQNSALRIVNASLKDDGVYQCFVSNSFGSVHSSKANISIVVFPKFTKIPEDLQVKTGSIARLPCAAEGLPEPKMSWQKDGGNDFPAARERRMHVMPDDDVFFIVNVKPFDMGVYSCMARNDAGVNITNASLTILETPSFVKMMENKDVRVGQAVVLECISTGSPKPLLKWRKDGTLIRASERYHFTSEDELLIIRNTQPEDAGRYECELSNPLGTEKGYSKLTIIPASGSLISDDDMAGIIIITVVCCAVCTSIVWVVIIYQTRKHMARPPQPPSIGSLPGNTQLGDIDIQGTPDHSPAPLLVYGHPGGQVAGQVDTDSEHSSGKDSGTGDSDKRSRSHEDLLPPLLQHAGVFFQGKSSEVRDDCDDNGSDSETTSPAAQRLVGPARLPVKPPIVASVKHPQRQRRTNHDRCYRLSMSTHPQTATVHAARPSSYHCLPLAPPTYPPPQQV